MNLPRHWLLGVLALITVGFVAAELLGYVVIVKLFPVLGGMPARPRVQEGTP